jgi:C-terminal processing protease CtpA/Prc
MVRQIASYLVNERTHLNDIYERKSNETKECWADPKDADSMMLSMPVYILTSRSTFSAAEDFAYAMQVNKRASVVGETTGGGAHPVGPFAVGQGYVMTVPVARSINPITKTDWEGTGVIPDVPVRADEALVKAQELILLSRLSTVSNDQEKEQVQLDLYALRPVVTLTPNQWKSVAGQYEADGNTKFQLQISSKSGKLILRQEWDGTEVVFDALSDIEFFARDLRFPLVFTKNAQGESTQVMAFGRDLWIRVQKEK